MDITNINEMDTKNTQIQNNNLWIAQSVVTILSVVKQRRGNHLNHQANCAVMATYILDSGSTGPVVVMNIKGGLCPVMDDF